MAAHIEVAVDDAATSYGFSMRSAAIFASNPRGGGVNLTSDEKTALADLVSRTGIRIIAHSSYAVYPWDGSESARISIHAEQIACQESGIEGLVIHLPKRSPDGPDVVSAMAEGLLSPDAPSVKLFFENPAVLARDAYYASPEHLVELFASLKKINPHRFGLCIDTAHLWTSGVDLRSRDTAADWLRRVSDGVPTARMMFHLNDSARPIGHGPDTHAPLAAGRIWSGIEPAVSGLGVFINFARFHGITTILERDAADLGNDYKVLSKFTSGADL